MARRSSGSVGDIAGLGSESTRTAVTINVLANDGDPDGDSLTLDSVTQPSKRTAVANPNRNVTYTPFSDFVGGILPPKR